MTTIRTATAAVLATATTAALAASVVTAPAASAAISTFPARAQVSCLDDAVTPAGYAGYVIATYFQYTTDTASGALLMATSNLTSYVYDGGRWAPRSSWGQDSVMLPGEIRSVTAYQYYLANGSFHPYDVVSVRC